MGSRGGGGEKSEQVLLPFIFSLFRWGKVEIDIKPDKTHTHLCVCGWVVKTFKSDNSTVNI